MSIPSCYTVPDCKLSTTILGLVEICQLRNILANASFSEKSNVKSKLFFSFAGGFAKISQADIDGSSKFLKFLLKSSESLGTERALDCGAGIGRITKHLLSKNFDKVKIKSCISEKVYFVNIPTKSHIDLFNRCLVLDFWNPMKVNVSVTLKKIVWMTKYI